MAGAAECTARWDGGERDCSKCIDKSIKVENSELILSCLYVMYMVSFFAYLSLIRKDMIFFRQKLRRRLKIYAESVKVATLTNLP